MRIAVIGSGISGLGAAYLLARAHEVEVFEREPRAGGHTHTIVHDDLALDTGFLEHHGMLGFGRFGWRALTGGSDTYVRAIGDRLGPRLHLGLGARALRRTADGVEVRTDDGETRRFDKAVVATHADQALRLLEDPSREERRVLGGFEYTQNDVVLHTDSSFLPRAHAARASWNYRRNGDGRPTITYWLNRLQSLETETDYCVTLNEEVRDEHVLRRLVYDHPIYTARTLRAQAGLAELEGRRHTYYAGAHHGNGFHEDGLASGVRAASALGGG